MQSNLKKISHERMRKSFLGLFPLSNECLSSPRDFRHQTLLMRTASTLAVSLWVTSFSQEKGEILLAVNVKDLNAVSESTSSSSYRKPTTVLRCRSQHWKESPFLPYDFVHDLSLLLLLVLFVYCHFCRMFHLYLPFSTNLLLNCSLLPSASVHGSSCLTS